MFGFICHAVRGLCFIGAGFAVCGGLMIAGGLFYLIPSGGDEE